MKLKAQQNLDDSDVVANNAMNRERGLSGINSYEKELRFSIVDFINKRLETQPQVAWLDLCCGKGYALQQASQRFSSDKLIIYAVDLVGDFVHVAGGKFTVGSLPEALPDRCFDLITCVHGLHYIGDKLQVIFRATQCLTSQGIFLANLDHRNIKSISGKTLRGIVKLLRDPPCKYSGHVLCISSQISAFPFAFIGADDKAGANYTGQPVVDSYYDFRSKA
ncbi:class I SAM-dependent methyltransferase [Candidatus Uabimicrobium amorphum]|uniref:Methyltransferase n=1 Tax=Uabimicrobium amorphum TaxID=2596890 RepID=A0A5S9ILA3_UABAM|nr:class I SAM-dependent methyltransferase [Candidatus Uabimicrobium amorphum]BBM83441.1 methyltransferase [Candidatus Uabimicrobium amorphum]